MITIATLTFAPCIDKSFSVPQLQPEKKLKCTIPVLEPGGGGINVARALLKLGTASISIFPEGGYTGKFLKQLVEEAYVKAVAIEVVHETRENIIVFEEKTGNQYRFGMPASELSVLDWRSCVQALNKLGDLSYLVISGSLPGGAPPALFADLSAIAASKKAELVIDSAGPELRQAAGQGVFLMKPSLRELGILAGDSSVSVSSAAHVARTLINRGTCEVFIVSLGAAGAVLVTRDISLSLTPPSVVTKSTVGAGDSMVAGVLHFLAQGRSLQEAAAFGVACGTSSTQHAGTQLCDKDGAEKLYPLVKVQAT
jgi:6-phosphofructokinase 2